MEGTIAFTLSERAGGFMVVGLANPVLLFLDELEAGGRAPSTLKNYASVLRSLQLYLGIRHILDATPLDVRDHLDSRQSINTKVLHLISLRKFFRFALKRGMISEDPTQGIPLPRSRRREYIPLTEDEVVRLLEACAPDVRVLVHVLIRTGARLGETCRIRVEDVSLEESGGTIDFPVRKGWEPGYAAFGPDLALALRSYRPTSKEWLFPHSIQRGRPMSPFIVEKRLLGAAKRAGVAKRVTPHMLRHSFSTWAVEAGWPQMALQKQLGHRDPRSTVLYYHPTRKGLRTAYDRAFGKDTS